MMDVDRLNDRWPEMWVSDDMFTSNSMMDRPSTNA